MHKIYYVYMVRCSDGSLYTGYTVNLERRVKAHNEGKGAKYTKGRRPVELVFYCELSTKDNPMAQRNALRLEYRIKKLSKEDKESLVEDFSKMMKNKTIV